MQVTLSVVATLLLVQYWRQIALDSHRFEPLFLINSTRNKLGYLSESLTVFDGVDEYINGSYIQNSSTNLPEKVTDKIRICPPIPPNLSK